MSGCNLCGIENINKTFLKSCGRSRAVINPMGLLGKEIGAGVSHFADV